MARSVITNSKQQNFRQGSCVSSPPHLMTCSLCFCFYHWVSCKITSKLGDTRRTQMKFYCNKNGKIGKRKKLKVYRSKGSVFSNLSHLNLTWFFTIAIFLKLKKQNYLQWQMSYFSAQFTWCKLFFPRPQNLRQNPASASRFRRIHENFPARRTEMFPERCSPPLHKQKDTHNMNFPC